MARLNARRAECHPDRPYFAKGQCKSCYGLELARKDTPYAAAVRARKKADQLKRKYGITPDDVDILLTAQGGVCAICRGELTVTGPRQTQACIDHSHTLGHVRGVLCRLCNAGLGAFLDNPLSLRRAAAYIHRTERAAS